MINLAALHNYLQAQYPGKVEGVRINADNSRGYLFADGVSDADQATITAAGNAFTIPELPEVPSFEAAVFQDSTIPVASRVQMAPLFPLLREHVAEDATRMQFWAGLVQIYGAPGGFLDGNCSDNVPIITKVQNYAATYNMPLVP